MHSMACVVTFLLNVSYFKSFPCSTPEWIQQLLYNFELVDLVRYGNTRNEWYPGGLQISLHIDLPDF